MGQRANLLVVQNNQYEIYYDHWCANTIDDCIFWGEQETVEFFRSHKKNERSNWLDNAWCEGAALIDLDKKVLLFFGGEDIKYEIPIRKTYLDLLQLSYKDYTVKWAHNGIIDIAEYVGESKDLVYDKSSDDKINIENIKEYFKEDISDDYNIITIKNIDDTIDTVTNSTLELNWLFLGNDLFKILDEFKSSKKLDLSNESYPPWSGVHFDISTRTIYLWRTTTNFDFDKFIDVWHDWNIVDLLDNYSQHIELAEGFLILPQPNKYKLVERLKSILVKTSPDNLELIDNITKALLENGQNVVEVSSATKLTENFTLEKDKKEDYFNKIKEEYFNNDNQYN